MWFTNFPLKIDVITHQFSNASISIKYAWLGKTVALAEQICSKAANYVMEFLGHNQSRSSNEMATGRKWKPSPARIFKVNVAERSFSEDRMGIGIVVTCEGWFQKFTSCLYDWNNTWRMAKAILRALHFCVDTGFHSSILECSNAAVVSLLQGDSKCYTELEWIIQNIQDVQRVLVAISFSVIN